MLAQHLITKPVFDALFGSYAFSENNPVSQTMQTMLDQLDDQALNKEAATLESFYASVRVRAEGIDNHEGRQAVITELYERFFKKALPKTADAFGIVYTPIPIVDFILRATNQVLKDRFGTTLSAEGVQVLDPFTERSAEPPAPRRGDLGRHAGRAAGPPFRSATRRLRSRRPDLRRGPVRRIAHRLVGSPRTDHRRTLGWRPARPRHRRRPRPPARRRPHRSARRRRHTLLEAHKNSYLTRA